MDQLDLRPGSHWDLEVERALSSCNEMIVILSPASVESSNVMDEVAFALDEGKTVIPVMYQQCKTPFRLRRLHRVDFQTDYNRGLQELLRELVPEVTPQRTTPASSLVVRPGATRVNPRDGLTYVWVPPGRFTMGCSPGDDECYDDEKPAHEAFIKKGFWIGQTPVTQEAFERVMGKNPSHFKGARLPVNSATWAEANDYCRAVEGRLPTEAEWEYAARAGSTASRYGEIDSIAWYDKNSVGKTHEVAQKAKNAWGLYDTLGNVWEWVADWYGPYPSGSVTDPRGSASGTRRVLRGGSWYYNSRFARVSFRNYVEPEDRGFNIGFRCARNKFPLLFFIFSFRVFSSWAAKPPEILGSAF
jgi:formylglycine-generating enzyme required for sulfatase activity